ncbi:hypothetical protein [Nocardia arthritidis]|uniref:Uncharacterized protein n=1 Tax=Nocardia arthritidis TaxID=228602 RepID=A0A6G9YDE0_9NOCA|nr:hypothetical protein [Nocardia arthritidis]QIS11184.1 hypothetical protein F5544_16525 [Nocardia arthritidis]
MSIVVTFTDRQPVAATGPNAGLQVWTYTVQASSPLDLSATKRIALALPADIEIQDPRKFPNIPALNGAFLEIDPGVTRQFAGKVLTQPLSLTQTISFVAPATQENRELLLMSSGNGDGWTVLPFALTAGAAVANTQIMPAPAGSSQVFTGRPLADFTGTFPYAAEIFGVYQPLKGWQGAQSTQMFAPAPADAPPSTAGILSPVGVVDLFREYFFEFDTFLGPPAGHLWLSPGGTVEVVETSTRRTLVEQSAEQSVQTTRKSEESLTDQTDIADAVKEENANDTKLGASAKAGANFAGIYHGDVSTSFESTNTTKKAAEQSHKQTRAQSSKVTSEIVRNFKTTFKTVTESTDTSSRRYVVQNTTDRLVNYELRRKMRKVGVQLQHIGSQLSWQVFLGSGPNTATPGAITTAPGRLLGLGEMVHVVPAPDLTSLHKPEPPTPLQQLHTAFPGVFPIRRFPGTTNAPHNDVNYTRAGTTDEMNSDDNDDHIIATAHFTASPPAPGYQLTSIFLVSAKTHTGEDALFVAPANQIVVEDAASGAFRVQADQVNFGGGGTITLNFTLFWNPPAVDPAQAEFERQLADYNAAVAELERKEYANAVRDRLRLLSGTRTRSADDLRKEEREAVFGELIKKIQLFKDNPHFGAETIRQLFDVDEMLYFVAPDFWRPDYPVDPPVSNTVGRYPVPPAVFTADPNQTDPVHGETVVSWYSHTGKENSARSDTAGIADEFRVNYLITEETQPAPMGSSLGWLIQADGDERRNEFLNAAWVKVVLPIRPGHELEALDWLRKSNVEGEAALDQPYQVQPGDPPDFNGKTIGQVLTEVATRLQATNTDIGSTLAAEKVFQTGFDPLDGGFRPPAPLQIFDQWVEVLPTDQIVAVEVAYDPKSGRQL